MTHRKKEMWSSRHKKRCRTRITSIAFTAFFLSFLVRTATAQAKDQRITFPIPSCMDVIIVPVTIENKSHLFAVDSGCMRSSVHESLRPLLKSRAIENSFLVDEIPVYWPPAMRVGSIDSDELGFVSCIDLSPVREGTGRDVDGILGMPLFEKYVIQMDFDRNQLVILPGSTEPSPEWGTSIPAPFGRVSVALDDKVVVECEIDTGSSAYMTLPFEIYDRLVEQKSMLPLGDNHFTSLNGTRVAQEGRIPTTKRLSGK